MEIKIMPYNSKKLVSGVGRKGDGVAYIYGKPTKAYVHWTNMLKRCHCPKWLSKYPTYIDCSVCSDWLYFPTFQKWFDKNYVKGWQLDKDLLVTGNKEYGPNTSCFVPQSLNKLFNDSGRARGDFPIGVHHHRQTGKFQAELNIDGTGKYLGLFDTAEDAHQAYLIAKKEKIVRVANEWKDKISDKLYNALIKKAEELI